jgi:hypothetical protein
MKKKCFNNSLLVAITIAIVCSGCATGQKFAQVPPVVVPPDKALIYIYRPTGFFGLTGIGDIATGYNFKGNGFSREHLGYLENGGFFTSIMPPGELTLTGTVKFDTLAAEKSAIRWGVNVMAEHKLITLNIEAGKTYYLKFWYSALNALNEPKMKLVDSETGLREINKCKLTNLARSELSP